MLDYSLGYSKQETMGGIMGFHKIDLGIHTGGRGEIQGHPLLHSYLNVSYMRPCLMNKRRGRRREKDGGRGKERRKQRRKEGG